MRAARRSVPLIITEDVELLDDLLRLCAAAGSTPEVHHGLPERRGAWDEAPLILVGADAARRLRGAPRRGGMVLVGRDRDDPDVWRHAVGIGADHVLMVPDDEQWLVDRIADVAEGVGRPAFTVGVIGGRGGAGASTLACALAVTGARAGHRTMLVDADPLGGGLDVLLGGESADGLRWPDLAASRGRVGSGALEDSLPEVHALRVLSWDRGDEVAVPPEAMRAVLGAARRRGGIVVVDLPRRVDDGTAQALAQVDLGLLVVPAELRAVAAAARVVSAAGTALRDLRVVVRADPAARAGLAADEVARLLDLPLAGELPHDPGLSAALEAGTPPGRTPKAPLTRFCTALWDRLPDVDVDRAMGAAVNGDAAVDADADAHAGAGEAAVASPEAGGDAGAGWGELVATDAVTGTGGAAGTDVGESTGSRRTAGEREAEGVGTGAGATTGAGARQRGREGAHTGGGLQ